MQLPKNTVPADSKFLAPMFPGAGLKAADAEALDSVGAPAGKGKFDQLFDDLAPEPKVTASPAANESAAAENILCTLPFVSTPPIENVEEISLTEGEGGLASIEGETGEDVASSNETPTAPTAGRRGIRGSKSPIASGPTPIGTEGDVAQPTNPGLPSSSVGEMHLPNEHASEKAFQTPRFTGLPESALEHRQAATLPPGISRLMAGNAAPVAPNTDIPETAAEGVETAGAEPQPFEGSFGTRPTVWPGASGKHHTTPFSLPQRNQREAGDGAVGAKLTEDLVPDGSDVAATPIAEMPAAVASLASEENDMPVMSIMSRFDARLDEQTATEAEVGDEEMAGDSVVRDVAGRLDRANAKPEFATVARPSAKIADAHQRRLAATARSGEKSFVSAEIESVTLDSKRVGTAVAKWEADMFTRFLPTSAQPSAPDHQGVAVTALEQTPHFAANPELVPIEPVSTAHEAVEVVLRTVEQASSQERNSVNLRFAVGDADLSVRVELHSNQVHTTFRTDSPELRAALSREWDAMANAHQGERTLKLVPAFVTASEHSALNSFAGDASSRQRDPRAQQEAEERAIRLSARPRSAAPAALVATPHLGSGAVAPLTSRRLHTVA